MTKNTMMVVTGGAASLTAADDRAVEYQGSAVADRTRDAYRGEWRSFTGWCADRGVAPLPSQAGTVAAYLAHMADAGRKASTIRHHLTTITQAHKAAGITDPPTRTAEVRRTLQGIMRERGSAQTRKLPFTPEQIEAIDAALPDTLAGARDRAIIRFGIAMGGRRSELAGLDVADVDFNDMGAVVTLRRSKTDPEGKGRQIGVPHGPGLAALRVWMQKAGITEGAIFRPVNKGDNVVGGRLAGQAVDRIVKRCAEAIGLDSTMYGGHTLRATFVTGAYLAGADDASITRTTGHRSLAILNVYKRPADLFRRNAAAIAGF